MDQYKLNQRGSELLKERQFSLEYLPLARKRYFSAYGGQTLLSGDLSLQANYYPIYIERTLGILAIYYRKEIIGTLCLDSTQKT